MSVNFANYVRLDIPEGRVKKINRKSDGLVLWTAGYFNEVRRSINSDGTIYNGTGYKHGVRIRSGGAEGDSAEGTATGYIPVKSSDIIRVSGCGDFFNSSVNNAFNVYDASFTNQGQAVANSANYGYGKFQGEWANYRFGTASEESDGVYKWTVPPVGTGYIRVTAENCANKGASLIVTVNEEIV